ncbi:MAG: ABC transporter ATP-binding protein [Cyclobacteriaceae bacterium]
MPSILSVEQVSKIYQSGSRTVQVLDEIDFDVQEGKTMAIVGPSGSGKTTLLGLCAGLDSVSEGSVTLNNVLLNKLTEDELALVRNKYVGFVFQNFQLIPTLTALENVMVPLELRGLPGAKEISEDLLSRVGLQDRMDHYPTQLSGGEQQRVAIARAFSNNPRVLFADEPTGNLDEETGKAVENLLFEINKEKGTTLIIVTHDLELANKTDQIIRLKGGKVVN